MSIDITPFSEILASWGLSADITNNIIGTEEALCLSPLRYASKVIAKSNDEANNFDHSHRVLQNCISLSSCINEKLSHNDYLILFYASLLHDVSKSQNIEIKEELESFVGEYKDLFKHTNCDHGVRSAYYLKHKNTKKIQFYGLDVDSTRILYNVIAFHSSATMHSCFCNKNISRKELLLCLLFWLADISDAVCDRVSAAATVEAKKPKIRARESVTSIEIKSEAIIWMVNKEYADVNRAVVLANKELSKHKLLLIAFGLPAQIVISSKFDKCEEQTITHEDLAKQNIVLDVKDRNIPLIISVDTVSEAYERIVEAFHMVEVNGQANNKNYFGPLVIDIKDIQNDDAEKINVRSHHSFDITQIKKYTQKWLSAGNHAADDFYFGYTHGQRIHKYVFPKEQVDLSSSKFYEWHGKREQFKNVVNLLRKEGADCRRAYVVISHPMIDNSDKKDKFHHETSVQPSLIAMHFRIEDENKLSAFAFLRSQEMSTFFLVNYFEIKTLIELLAKELSLSCGRVVMSTSLAYFDRGSSLLDKPALCQNDDAGLRNTSIQIDKQDVRDKFISDLKEIGTRNYIKTESGVV